MQNFCYLFLCLMIHCEIPEKPAAPPSPIPLKVAAIPLPAGYSRIAQSSGSFGSWLRDLPLKTDKTVYLYNGEPKRNQSAQYAVIDLSVGSKDLQQCADAVIRLKAEYLFQMKDYEKIRFHATDGTVMDYESWRKGYRFVLRNRRLNKIITAAPSSQRTSFNQYLDLVFSFAGTLSLQKELLTVNDPEDMQPGDVYIQGGSPGHAVIVLDVAKNAAGEKVFLLAQSYMPAQDIHILKNPSGGALGPWYRVSESTRLITPEWDFSRGHLARFPDS